MANNFHNKTWFITGATGLVGSTIITKLLETDANIIALLRKGTPEDTMKWFETNDVKVFFGDLLDIESFKYQLGTCDIVVHTAAAILNRSEKDVWDVNYEGTKNIVNAMTEFKVKRLIHISTVGVYGQSKEEPMDENTITSPIGAYSQSKFAAEKLILENKDKINPTIFRPPYIIGNVDKDRNVVPTLSKFLKFRILPYFWRKNQSFGFIHARDIASATLLAAGHEQPPSIIYNLQSFSVSISELVNFSEQIYEHKKLLIPIPFTIPYFFSGVLDIFLKIVGKTPKFIRRMNMLKQNYTFSTELIESELHWASQYKDKKKLYILLLKYYNRENGINLDEDYVIPVENIND